MAVVTNFKDRITDLVGSLGTADDNAIKQWLIDGCYDTIGRLKGVTNPMIFASKSGAITTSVVVELDTIREFLSVERNNIECNGVAADKRHLYTSGDSIYEATADDPVYYINNGQVTVVPTPTASQAAYYTYIPEYSITDFDTSTSSVDGFPNEFYEHILIYAAIMVASRRMQDLMDDTSVNTMYSLDNIRDLFDNDKPTSSTDIFALLAEEDIDMVGVTLGVSDAASKLISTKYTWLRDKIDFLTAQYMSKFPRVDKGDR